MAGPRGTGVQSLRVHLRMEPSHAPAPYTLFFTWLYSLGRSLELPLRCTRQALVPNSYICTSTCWNCIPLTRAYLPPEGTVVPRFLTVMISHLHSGHMEESCSPSLFSPRISYFTPPHYVMLDLEFLFSLLHFCFSFFYFYTFCSAEAIEQFT